MFGQCLVTGELKPRSVLAVSPVQHGSAGCSGAVTKYVNCQGINSGGAMRM